MLDAWRWNIVATCVSGAAKRCHTWEVAAGGLGPKGARDWDWYWPGRGDSQWEHRRRLGTRAASTKLELTTGLPTHWIWSYHLFGVTSNKKIIVIIQDSYYT